LLGYLTVPFFDPESSAIIFLRSDRSFSLLARLTVSKSERSSGKSLEPSSNFNLDVILTNHIALRIVKGILKGCSSVSLRRFGSRLVSISSSSRYHRIIDSAR